jgi:MYXO-CTERM domain-containing protein
MPTATTTATLGRVAFVAAVLGGLCLPATAHATRAYICEHPIDGYCEATRDSRTIECFCRGESTEMDVPELETATDDELRDACWEAYAEVCTDAGRTVECEAEDRGACEATSAEGGRIECECNDGRTEHELDASGLEDLDKEGLEDACYERLDTLCAPLPPTTPVMGPVEPLQMERGTTGCRTGGEPTWWLMLLPVLGLFRRRRG